VEAVLGRIEQRLTSLEQRTYDIKPGPSSPASAGKRRLASGRRSGPHGRPALALAVGGAFDHPQAAQG